MSIENLNQKLNGELPVTREELLVLVKSWGKIDSNNGDIENIGSCYDLSRLDVSQITDMSYIFSYSGFNRDRMNDIDLKDKYGDEIDDFFSNIKLKIIEKTKNNL